RRMKITYHTREPLNFPYDAASEIVGSLGGDVHFMARKVAASFDYVFHFIQLADKSKKKLKSIHELSYNRSRDEIQMKPLCEYDFLADKWQWQNELGEDKKKAAAEENASALEEFSHMLSRLGGGA
ncbi:MAG: hypothetical protein FWG53_06745, partial [Clostridiales bacterium]|nr:hypothetical protein [Clostridiales bacterium]